MHRSASLFKIFRCLSTKAEANSNLDSKHDPDVFGTLSRTGKRSLAVETAEKVIAGEKYEGDREEFDIGPRKNAYYYKYEITKWARQGGNGLKRALELFQEMKAKARLTPTVHNFSPLIYGCAKAGYTKRAFDLYEESLRYINKPTKCNVTSLLNACSESPFPEYGLKRLDWFLTHLKVTYNYEMNRIQYNCAIKAYGKLGRIEEATKLVQEMIDNGIYPDYETFNMLLVGCASHKEAGCLFALRVIKCMQMYDIKPSVHTYQLLLRCIRDCGIGTSHMLAQYLHQLPSFTSLEERISMKKQLEDNKDKLKQDFDWAPLISEVVDRLKEAVSDSQTANSTKNAVRETNVMQLDALTPIHDAMQPNFLIDEPLNLLTRIKSIRVEKLTNPKERLMLFGGVTGYLEAMMKTGCKPDKKVFTLLVNCIEPTEFNIKEYLKLSETFGIPRDPMFYDVLLNDYCSNMSQPRRLDFALYLVEQMQSDQIRPSISTFEKLAFACDTWTQARQLLSDIEKSGLRTTDELLANLFQTAILRHNFRYLNSLINHCRNGQFKPPKDLVERLENLKLVTSEHLLKQEKGVLPPNVRAIQDIGIKSFEAFRKNMGSWLTNIELATDDHPWKQYKVDTSSKRDGLNEFVKQFRQMEKNKREASSKA